MSSRTCSTLSWPRRCRITDQEFEARQKARGEEISAVSEAIAILSDDDAHDLFSKTLGFVQVRRDASLPVCLVLSAWLLFELILHWKALLRSDSRDSQHVQAQ